MKLKQKNLLPFLGGSVGAMSTPQVTDRQSLRAGITFDVGEVITSPVLIPKALPFLCRSQKSLLFVLAGLSFQVVGALMLLKTANSTTL